MSNNQNKGEKKCECCSPYRPAGLCECNCHTPQSVGKEEKHKTLIDEIANHTSNYLRPIPQPTTLGTTMEFGLKQEYLNWFLEKADTGMVTVEMQYNWWLEKLSQSKAEIIKECIEKCNGAKCPENYSNDLGYNQALQDVINLLSKDIEQ